MNCVSDLNVLYDAFKASMKSSSWKRDPQRFERDFLSEIVKLHDEIEDRTYKTSESHVFITHERGKARLIHGGRMRDRVMRHALCDSVLNPTFDRYIIYDNSASQKGKGIDFARQRFERDLHNYWLKYRTNEGWVCFIDFSKFYDNIRHDLVKEAVCKRIDEQSAWLFSSIIDTFQVDVSYMTDEEYARCLDEKFDSIKYYENVPKDLRTGKRFMAKSVDIGDQISQSIGVYYPTPIDNYITIVRGHQMAGRYMDDIRIIDNDLDHLKETLEGVYKQAEEQGLYINKKKTRICRLSDWFTYLQMKYRLSDTGKVIKKVKSETVTRERKKLKKYKKLIDKGEASYRNIEQSYKSWMGKYVKVMSKRQTKNMKRLYYELFKEEPRWKKEFTQSHSRTEQHSATSG